MAELTIDTRNSNSNQSSQPLGIVSKTKAIYRLSSKPDIEIALTILANICRIISRVINPHPIAHKRCCTNYILQIDYETAIVLCR